MGGALNFQAEITPFEPEAAKTAVGT